MDQEVAERDNLGKLRNRRGELCVNTGQLRKCFTDYRELSFDSRMKNDIRVELLECLPIEHRHDGLDSLLCIPQQHFRVTSNNPTRERSNSAFR